MIRQSTWKTSFAILAKLFSNSKQLKVMVLNIFIPVELSFRFSQTLRKSCMQSSCQHEFCFLLGSKYSKTAKSQIFCYPNSRSRVSFCRQFSHLSQESKGSKKSGQKNKRSLLHLFIAEIMGNKSRQAMFCPIPDDQTRATLR